ncbi:sensor histidine kinase [Microlunatus endophyticus]|uniref:sensor histidine kinase n=1 Tax=Microlunatus endophyticus TaxID=1716077 RepID=UPI00166A10DF|nr:GAF domain-containing protein [Microlunatus endophyticus]
MEGVPPTRRADVPKLEIDELVDQFLERADEIKRARGRVWALLQSIESVTGDLSLERVLRRIVESACELVGAQYGALGVIGHDSGLEQFIHIGVDDEIAKRIGHLPEGKGLLGALITDPRPIRLRHMTDDSRSTGFPAGHPQMESFLGVPVHVRDEVYGNLYLANSENGEFSADDEELVVALALAAGTAISNARLYREAELRQRWLEASAEVQEQLLSTSGEDPLRTIARRSIEIADADLVTVGLLTPDRDGFVIEFAFGERAEELVARRFPLTGTIGERVIAGGEPYVTAIAGDPQVPSTHVATVIEVGPLISLPLRGNEEPRGLLTLARKRGRRDFTETEVAMAAGFASHASVALELADVRAAEQKMIMLEDRDRIARDLHDHVIQELFAIGLSIEGVAGQLQSIPALADRLRNRVEDLDRAIRRIRTSIFELRGNLAVSQEGLRLSILEVISDVTPALGFPPSVSFAGLLDLQLPEMLTQDVIAAVRETLTNVAKHAHATSVSVDVELAGDELTINVADNGVGVGDPSTASGVANLRTRAGHHHGSFVLTAGPGGGTVAIWRVRTR